MAVMTTSLLEHSIKVAACNSITRIHRDWLVHGTIVLQTGDLVYKQLKLNKIVTLFIIHQKFYEIIISIMGSNSY